MLSLVFKMRVSEKQLEGKTYYSVPKAAGKLQVPAQKLRTILKNGWLNENEIDTNERDVMKDTLSNQIYINSELVDKMREKIYVPVLD